MVASTPYGLARRRARRREPRRAAGSSVVVRRVRAEPVYRGSSALRMRVAARRLAASCAACGLWTLEKGDDVRVRAARVAACSSVLACTPYLLRICPHSPHRAAPPGRDTSHRERIVHRSPLTILHWGCTPQTALTRDTTTVTLTVHAAHIRAPRGLALGHADGALTAPAGCGERTRGRGGRGSHTWRQSSSG